MRKIQRFCLLIFFLALFQCTYAQTTKIDSLKSELIRNSESNRFDVLWGLAYELFDVNNTEAVGFAKRAHEVALEGGDSLKIVKSGRILGQLLRRVGRVDDAMEVFERVLKISERGRFKKETMSILNSVGFVYVLKSEFDKALESNIKCLLLREQEDDKKGVSMSLMNLGLVHYKLKNFSIALDYFLKALKWKDEIGDSVDVNILLINIGLCYSYLNDFDRARAYFDKMFRLCGSDCEPSVVIHGEFGIANCFFKEKHYLLAKIHYSKALNLSIQLNNKRMQIESIIELANISLIQKDLTATKRFLKNVDSIQELKQYRELELDVYEVKAKFFEHKKDYRFANWFRKKYSDLNELIFNSELNRNLTKLQMQLAEKENLARIESQSKVLALQQKALDQQRLLNIFIGLMAVLTIGLVIVLFKINRQKQRINSMLDERVRERTFELEENRVDLTHAYNAQALILRKISSDSISYLATLRGLSIVAANELPEHQAIYIKKAEQILEKLIVNINKYIPIDRR